MESKQQATTAALNSFEATSEFNPQNSSYLDVVGHAPKDDDKTTHQATNVKSDKNPMVQIDFDMTKTDVKSSTV